jgi:hypothetical protein
VLPGVANAKAHAQPMRLARTLFDARAPLNSRPWSRPFRNKRRDSRHKLTRFLNGSGGLFVGDVQGGAGFVVGDAFGA